MRLVFAGTPVTALPSLDAIAASAHELVGVVTRPASPQGRSARLVPSPVASWAHEHGVEVLAPEHPKDRDFRERLAVLAPDCCPVVAYGALLPQRTLDIPAHGWVNLHFSLLPAYRGAAPVQRAIMDGVRETGAETPSNQDRLRELGWLVGNWQTKSEGVDERQECTADGTGLTRRQRQHSSQRRADARRPAEAEQDAQ